MLNIAVGHVCLNRGYTPTLKQIELLIKALGTFGIKQYLICRDDSPLLKAIKGIKEVTIVKIHGVVDPKYTGHFKVLRRVDVIHAHDLHGYNWAFFHFMMFGTPYILSFRNNEIPVNNFVNRTLFNWASSICVSNSIIAENIKDQFDIKAQIVPSCTSNFTVNDEQVEQIKGRYQKRYIIGMVADLINRYYGQATIIEAVELLKNKIPHLIVLLIGKGDDIGLLRAKAKGNIAIKFLGDKKNYYDYIKAMDLYINPVNIDTRTSVMLDVMDLGVPIISTNVGLIPEIVKDRVTAYVIPAQDPQALADAILDLKNDSNLRHTLIYNAKNMAASHDPLYSANNYVNIYKKLVLS